MTGNDTVSSGTISQGLTARLVGLLSRFPLHLVIVGIGLLWMTPAIGLLTSSFRDATVVANSGWWTAFQLPFDFTLENRESGGARFEVVF